MQTSLSRNPVTLIKTITKNNHKKLSMGLFLIAPLIPFLALELFFTNNPFSIMWWLIHYPKEFLVNYFLMFGLTNLFYALPRKVYLIIAAVFASLFSIVGYVSRQKLILKGDPLIPSDFFLTKEAVKISDHLTGVYLPLVLIGISAVIIIFAIIKFIPREKYFWPKKIGIFMLATALLFIFNTAFSPIQKAFGFQLINWSQKMNYDQNGMLLGFILDAKNLIVQKPENYQEDAVKQIVSNTKASYAVDPNFKPNIIFVMSEAFWDPTLMKNISFSQDPIPFFHSLQKTQTNGVMLSPVYGGGTANTEFEALTGFSTQLLPGGIIPYAQSITRPIEALPAVLNRQSYATSAIHTYHDWFYNRSKVYQNFGFNKFVSMEFFNDPEKKGQYIRDTELSQKILDEVKETDKPDFIYAVSMEDHGPYSTNENPENTIKASGADLSPDAQAILDNYSNTISDVDQSLKQLIDGLKQINEPTVVIFFGDHLPMLGNDYSVYKEASFIRSDNSYQDYLNLHSVPFVTWNNFSSTKQSLRLSSDFLGTYILELTKKAGSPMTNFLSNLMQKGSDVIVDPNYQSEEKLTPEELDQYNLLQYDLLSGNKYTYKLEPDHAPTPNTGYIQGDGVPKIKNLLPSDSSLKITGEHFVKNDIVYINGKSVKTTFENDTTIVADLPKSLSSNPSSLEVQIKLTDSMGNDISQSAIFRSAD